MRIYLDDMRDIPRSYEPARNYDECIKLLEENKGKVDIISLDHDLGEAKTGYSVCKWIIENEYFDGLKEIHIHSANPVGKVNMIELLDRYLPSHIDIIDKSYDHSYKIRRKY